MEGLRSAALRNSLAESDAEVPDMNKSRAGEDPAGFARNELVQDEK